MNHFSNMYSNLAQQASAFNHNARNEVRFSTKPYCPTTGLIEYQFRKCYSIEEAGGLNLYAFCGNDGAGRFDVLDVVHKSKLHKIGIDVPLLYC